MKKTLLLLLIPSLLIVGCRGRGESTVEPTSTTSVSSTTSFAPTSSSDTTVSTVTSETSSGTTTSSTSEETSSSASSTTDDIPTTSSISDVKTKAEAYKDKVPSGSHQYFSDEIVVTKGRVIQCVAVGVSQEILVYIADGEDMICILTNGQSKFYNSCSDYIGDEGSNYIITGNIGYYYSLPTINLTNYELRQSMKFDIDYSKYSSIEYTSIEKYNDKLLDLDYNKKGYGEGELVTLKNLLCIAKADDNSWLFSDGSYVQGGYHQTSNTAFTIGNVYDLFGISCLYQWKPSIRVLEYTVSSVKTTVDIKALAVEKTAAQMYSIGAPSDDTEKSAATNNFIKTFKYFYKSNTYFNAYGQAANGYYLVSGDNYYSDIISSKETAATNKMFKFNNESLNKFTDLSHVSVRDFIFQNTPLTMYFVEYQFTTINKKEVPQVYMFEDFVPRLSFPELELKSFFSNQTYLITEGKIPEYDLASEYEILNTSDAFEVMAYGITKEMYDAHVTECNADSYLKIVSNTPSDNKYKHSASNPKFTYEIIYVSTSEAMKIIINHA